MITLKQLLESITINAETVDIHSWNEEKWDYDDFFGFCGYPTNEDLINKCEEVLNYKVVYMEAEDQLYCDKGYLRIEIQKGDNNNE